MRRYVWILVVLMIPILTGCGTQVDPKTKIVRCSPIYNIRNGQPVPPEGIRRMDFIVVILSYRFDKIIQADSYMIDLAGNLDLTKIKEATFYVYANGPKKIDSGNNLIIRDRDKYYSAIFVEGARFGKSYCRMTIKDVKPIEVNDTLRYLPDRPPVNSALIKGLVWYEPAPNTSTTARSEPNPKEVE